MKKVINLETNTIDFTFGEEGNESSVSVVTSDFSEEIIAHATLHGLSQKIGDSAAAAKKLAEAEGETRNLEEIRQACVLECITNLQENGWTAPRQAGEGSTRKRKTVSAKLDGVKANLLSIPAGKERNKAHDTMVSLMGLSAPILTKEELAA